MEGAEVVVEERTSTKLEILIEDLIKNSDYGWSHPYTIYSASLLVSDFGVILEKNSHMIWGAPETLLPSSKEEIKLSMKVLFKFLRNKSEWDYFREEYPKDAPNLISNDFYQALLSGYPRIELFISEEEAQLCIELSNGFVGSDYGQIREFLMDNSKFKQFSKVQETIIKRTKESIDFLKSKGMFSIENIFD